MNNDTAFPGRGKKQWDILVIDDEQVIIDAVVKICSSENFSVDSAIDARAALTKLVKNNYRLIICDIMMPGMDGFEFLDELTNRKINSALIMTTGFSTVDNAVRSLYNGAIDFIPKPFTADELLSSVIRGMKYLEIQSLLKTQKDDSAVIYVPCPAKYFRLGYSSWAAEESTGSILIGATDLFVKTIGNFSSIDLLNPDEELIQGNSGAFFKDQQERIFTLLSPITGRILESNSEIVKDKTLLEKDPYFEGWIYRILPSESEYELKKLINCSSDRL